MSAILSILFVGAGGFIGAVFRYIIGLSIPPNSIGFHFATLVINVIGAFAIGFISGIFANKESVNQNLVLFLTVGVCGGFTTFSAFSLEVFSLMEGGKHWVGFGYALLSFVFCIIGVTFGRLIAKTCAA